MVNCSNKKNNKKTNKKSNKKRKIKSNKNNKYTYPKYLKKISWTDFLKESMPIYMDKYKNTPNPHAKAMKEISSDWKEYKKRIK